MLAVMQALKSRPNTHVAYMLDTKGPQIRTGLLEKGQNVKLTRGQTLQITTDYQFVGNNKKIACSYKGLTKSTTIGGTVLISDSSISCRTTKIFQNHIQVQVLNDAVLGQKKNMALPGKVVDLPTLGPNDINDIVEFGNKYDCDIIALSFARYKKDIIQTRQLCKGLIRVMPKIQNHQAIQNIDEILQQCNALMVARGDLGMQIPLQKTIIAQKYLLRRCLSLGIPSVTATQMLDSMQKKPTPTRAQVSDVTNAIIDLTDATMLSGQTTNGKYPVQSVQFMNKIAQQAENIIDYYQTFKYRTSFINIHQKQKKLIEAILISFQQNIDIIICQTQNGKLPSNISKYRPWSYIFVICQNQKMARHLTLVRSVYPVVCTGSQNDNIQNVLQVASKKLNNPKLSAIYIKSKQDLIQSFKKI